MISFIRKIILSIKNTLFFNKLNFEWKRNVFFSENSSYSAHFENLIEKFYRDKIKLCFFTSDENDLIFKYQSENLKVLYITPVIGQIILLNYINCYRLIMTMPDLDNFHIKKSKNCKKYFYIFHSPFSTNMIYRNKAFFNFDEFCCVGNHHIEEINEYINKFKLNKKILLKSGYFRIDQLNQLSQKNNNKKILIAPSWGEKNIITDCGFDLIKTLISSDYNVILRPHIHSLKKNKLELLRIKKKFSSLKNFSIEEGNFSLKNISECDYLITDWSGISIEFAFAFERPVIFIDTPRKIYNSKFNDISVEPIETKIRNEIGIIIKPKEVHHVIKKITSLNSQSEYFQKRIIEQRNKYLFNFKGSVDYVYNYLTRLD